MSHEIITGLIHYWRESLFIEPFVVLSFTLCFIVGLIYHRKDKEKLVFLAYFFTGIILFVQNTLLVVGKLLTGTQLAICQEVFNTVFELTEFIAFYYFFKKSLRNNKFKRVLKTSLYILSTIIAVFLAALPIANYSVAKIKADSLVINVIEFFFLFIMCLAYFRELFTDAPTKNLFTRSSFLIVTSTFFYTILMIPFFLIASDVRLTETSIYSTVTACHYLLLIVLLLSISKAFLCKQPITT